MQLTRDRLLFLGRIACLRARRARPARQREELLLGSAHDAVRSTIRIAIDGRALTAHEIAQRYRLPAMG